MTVGLVLLGQEPLDGLVVAPLNKLADLVAHKVELGTGVRHLVEGQRAQAGKLAPPVARHAADERALAVHDLVVAQRANKVLGKGVHDGEREQAVVAGAPRKIGLHVVQGIVHPAHVPLVVEAQAAVLRRVGHEWPRGGLLGHHHYVGVVRLYSAVDLTDKCAGVQILLGTVLVELLLTGIVNAKVEVQHAGHAVHANAVNVEVLEPVQHVGDQEGADLAAGEVELVRAPVGVNLVLKQHVAVKGGKAVGVGAKTAGHPVHDHADAGLVACIDKVHELLRVAVARRGSVVAGRLVAPGAIEGMLHKRHDLDMRIAHVAYVVHELHRQVVVGIKLAALCGERIHGAGVVAVLVRLALRRIAVAFPRANMHLVDVERLRHVVMAGAALEPRGVVPLVAIEGPQHARRSRRALGLKGVRIGLVELFALVGLDKVLIELALLCARNKTFPNSARMHGHQRVGLLIPVVKFANDMDALYVGRPNAKAPAARTVLRVGVRAHLFPAALPRTDAKQIDIILGELRCVRGGFAGSRLFGCWL